MRSNVVNRFRIQSRGLAEASGSSNGTTYALARSGRVRGTFLQHIKAPALQMDCRGLSYTY